MATRAIDLDGLPEEDVKAVESFVSGGRDRVRSPGGAVRQGISRTGPGCLPLPSD